MQPALKQQSVLLGLCAVTFSSYPGLLLKSCLSFFAFFFCFSFLGVTLILINNHLRLKPEQLFCSLGFC